MGSNRLFSILSVLLWLIASLHCQLETLHAHEHQEHHNTAHHHHHHDDEHQHNSDQPEKTEHCEVKTITFSKSSDNKNENIVNKNQSSKVFHSALTTAHILIESPARLIHRPPEYIRLEVTKEFLRALYSNAPPCFIFT